MYLVLKRPQVVQLVLNGHLGLLDAAYQLVNVAIVKELVLVFQSVDDCLLHFALENTQLLGFKG